MAGNAVKLSVLTEEDISSVLKGYTDREIMKLMKSAGRIIGQLGVKKTKAGLKSTGIKHPRKPDPRQLKTGIKRNRKVNYYTQTNREYGSPFKGIKYSSKKIGEVDVHIRGDFRLKWFEYGTAKRTTKKFKWINPRTGKGLKKRNANQFGRRTIGEHGNTLLGKTGWTHNRGQIKPTPFYLLAMSAMGDDAAELWKIAFYRAIENLTKKNRKIKKTVTQ